MSEAAATFEMDGTSRAALVDYILRLADDRIVLGHRLSEWCGHGPILEEDLALGNIALDYLGQGQAFLNLAGRIEGQGRNEDKLAFFRDPVEYRNAKLVELPRGDFAVTIARQFFFDVYSSLLMGAIEKSRFAPLAAIAAKCVKEDTYHLRHSSQWMLRLGDGTEESHNRIQHAVDELWPFTGELFETDAHERHLHEAFGTPLSESLRSSWNKHVAEHLMRATLVPPAADKFMHTGGRRGLHTEHLGHLLTAMQSLPRANPTAEW